MEKKAIVVLVDGMRPDGILQCGDSFLSDLAAESTASFSAQTVFPSVTLPCHTSLFFGVQPQRHGILTNDWHPMVRPFDSLGDLVARYFKKAAMFYNWEQLRDLNRPGSLARSCFTEVPANHQKAMESEHTLTDWTVDYIRQRIYIYIFNTVIIIISAMNKCPNILRRGRCPAWMIMDSSNIFMLYTNLDRR